MSQVGTANSAYRFHVLRMLLVMLLALAAGSLLFPLAAGGGVGPLLAVCGLLGFLVAFFPVYQAAIADRVDAGARGLSYGFTYLGMFGVGAGGAALAGTVLTYADPTTLVVVLAALVVVAAAVCVRLLVAVRA